MVLCWSSVPIVETMNVYDGLEMKMEFYLTSLIVFVESTGKSLSLITVLKLGIILLLKTMWEDRETMTVKKTLFFHLKRFSNSEKSMWVIYHSRHIDNNVNGIALSIIGWMSLRTSSVSCKPLKCEVVPINGEIAFKAAKIRSVQINGCIADSYSGCFRSKCVLHKR